MLNTIKDYKFTLVYIGKERLYHLQGWDVSGEIPILDQQFTTNSMREALNLIENSLILHHVQPLDPRD